MRIGMTVEERLAMLEEDLHELTKDVLEIILYLKKQEKEWDKWEEPVKGWMEDWDEVFEEVDRQNKKEKDK